MTRLVTHTRVLLTLAVLVLIALAFIPVGDQPKAMAATPEAAATTPLELLTRTLPDAMPNANQVKRGQYLVIAGDCMSCHLREGGEPLSGGLGLNTPFGVIYSSNITPDPKTGIGGWSSDKFYRAMHNGIGGHGQNLYPAFPYPWFRRVTREDADAIFSYLKTVSPVVYTPPHNRLPLIFNIRFLLKGWNALFFKTHDFAPSPSQPADWNRGAYLVEGLGHCGACHTPKNLLGADKANQQFHGGVLDNWVAPDLTGNDRRGLGEWSIDDIAEFLRTGRNTRADAGGSMADVITYSTSLMTEDDRHAIAVYLKTEIPSAASGGQNADSNALWRGAAIYSDACASCHFDNGAGQPTLFPPLGGDAMLQQISPTGVVHIILAGSKIGASPTRPSQLTMPGFAWKLSDQEIADVATYVRNFWGNRAEPVSTSQVRDMRSRLRLGTSRPTQNSGDR